MIYINSLKHSFIYYLEEFLIYLSNKSIKFCPWGFLDEVEIPVELLTERDDLYLNSTPIE